MKRDKTPAAGRSGRGVPAAGAAAGGTASPPSGQYRIGVSGLPPGDERTGPRTAMWPKWSGLPV